MDMLVNAVGFALVVTGIVIATTGSVIVRHRAPTAVVLLVAGIAVAGYSLASTAIAGSQPATGAEIGRAVQTAMPTCRRYVAARIANRIESSGAVSRSQLDTLSHPDCSAAAQYDAVVPYAFTPKSLSD